jgi:hypothetical protein
MEHAHYTIIGNKPARRFRSAEPTQALLMVGSAPENHTHPYITARAVVTNGVIDGEIFLRHYYTTIERAHADFSKR